jgi:hopene-associated glycosyltransferase HpnB
MTGLAVLSLLVWVYLLFLHGRFWQAGPVLVPVVPARAPDVTVVIPARDEAEVIGESLRSVLAQDYAGAMRVILVDDGSGDGTGEIARRLDDARLMVLTGEARPAGWSGKLWAVHQGVAASGASEFLLLTDADIVHDPLHLATLVERAERDGRDMVSEMVELACESPAERALVPAFVFFFQMLYPFAKVNDPLDGTAAAAGGTILIRRRALQRIGGIEAVRGALIDDVALAREVKKGGKIWLGHSALARSVRPYPAVGDIWRMITRTAYTQLRYSPVLLVLTVAGMGLVWLAPPLFALFGDGTARVCGLLAWVGAMLSYLPTLQRYRRNWIWALALPLIAVFYTAATVASAIDHMRGRGAVWKNRAYAGAGA